MSYIKIIGDAERDTGNGSRRVMYECGCGYVGTTRAARIGGMVWCQHCNRKYARLKTNSYRIQGDTAIIDVSTDKFPDTTCMVDAKDIDLVIDGKGRWFAANFSSEVVYAVRNQRGEKMHRHIIGASDDLVVDHDDGNGLNNKRVNLKECKQSQNLKNRTLDRRNVSGFYGVVPSPTAGKWVAQGTSDYKRFHLGVFESVHKAAAVRKAFERDHGFGVNHGRARV